MQEAEIYTESNSEPNDYELRDRILTELGLSLAKDRSDAIAWRSQSGIETEWKEDEEHSEGIDDANRGENKSAMSEKPAGKADARSKTPGSTVFYNITRPYVESASARIGDMLLPTDERNFSVKNTPKPELVLISNGEIPKRIGNQIDAAFPGDSERANKAKLELVDQVAAELKEAHEKAKKAEDQIDDWMVESQFHAEQRKIFEDAALVGCGILKGPIPVKSTVIAYKNGQLITQEEVKPASVRVNYWNFFPDPACGENIHQGSYVFERDDITSKELIALTGMGEDAGYFDDQIMAALSDGPHQAEKVFNVDQDMPGARKRDREGLFEIWYYYGAKKVDDLPQDIPGLPDSAETPYVNAHIVMVNNRVIKAALSHIDTGEFPYDVMVWQRRAGSWAGIGVARQIRTAQKMVNAATRNLMNNAGLAGGPMWAFNDLIQPLDGKYEIAPLKGWRVSEDGDEIDPSKAFYFYTIPMLQQDLQAIIDRGLKMAEEVTGLPFLLQGQQGSAPDTVGGMIMMHNNASTVLRRIARLFDDLVTKPHVRRYYQYLLLWGEDDCKGDFQIDARGSSTLVERDIHNQALLQLGPIIQNPVHGKDPKKWADIVLKAYKINPNELDYDDEEWKAIVQQMSQPQQDPTVQIAQMNIESKERIKAAEQDFQQRQLDTDREIKIAMHAIAQDNERRKQQGQAEMTMAEMQAELSKLVMQLNSTEKQTAAKLDTQVMLSTVNSSPDSKQVSTPPSEPAGRAAPGNAYQD